MHIKNGLVKEVKRQAKQREEQERLKAKYKIDENVRIVEKSNNFKFTVRMIARLWYLALNILLFILALIGSVALVYPASRQELLIIFMDLLGQLETLLGGTITCLMI